MTRLERKNLLIEHLANFISGNTGTKSIKLEMGNDLAKEWAEVRNASGVFGYLSVDDTKKHLKELLG